MNLIFITNDVFALQCLFIYFETQREGEKEKVDGEWGEREGERIPSRLHTVRPEPDVGLIPQP